MYLNNICRNNCAKIVLEQSNNFTAFNSINGIDLRNPETVFSKTTIYFILFLNYLFRFIFNWSKFLKTEIIFGALHYLFSKNVWVTGIGELFKMCRNKKIIINIGQICNCTYLQNAKKRKWTACKIKFMTHSENNKNSLYSVDLNMKTHFSTGCQYTFNNILTSICWSTCNNQLVSIQIY